MAHTARLDLTAEESSTLALLAYAMRNHMSDALDACNASGIGRDEFDCRRIVGALWRKLDEFGRTLDRGPLKRGELVGTGSYN